MAPEQFGGRSVPASDLYGLDATLIYLVTGLHPTELPQQDLRIQFADRVTHLNSNLIHWLEWMTQPSLDQRLSSAGEAWHSLNNPRPIDQTLMELQPPGSKIKLTKTSEFIEIVIPPAGVGFGLVALLSAAIAANSPSFVTVFNFQEDDGASTNLPAIAPQLIILSGSFLAAVGVMFLFALFRELRIRIDRQQISYSSHLLGLRWNHYRPASRQDICQLEIKEIAYKVSQLIIQAGNQKYRLGEEQKLSESEIYWLARELSQWWDLRINITWKDG
jgi:serine/threonine protein kinase